MMRHFTPLSGRAIALSILCAALLSTVACSSTPAKDDGDEPDDGAEATADHEHDDHDHHHDEDSHDHHDHSFDDPEKYAERWNDPERDDWQQPRAVVEAMNIEEGMTVADLGAGTGYFVPHLAEAVGEEGTVLAVDIEQAMLDFIDHKADEKGLDNVETVLAEADDSGLDEAAVDRVITVNTWHHIPDRADYSTHLLERLTDDGSVWVVDFDKDSPIGPPEEHRLAPETVIAELEAGGLDAKTHELELERQYVIVATH